MQELIFNRHGRPAPPRPARVSVACRSAARRPRGAGPGQKPPGRTKPVTPAASLARRRVSVPLDLEVGHGRVTGQIWRTLESTWYYISKLLR